MTYTVVSYELSKTAISLEILGLRADGDVPPFNPRTLSGTKKEERIIEKFCELYDPYLD